MSKTLKSIILSFLSAALLSGCFPTGEESSLPSKAPEEIESEISEIEAENDSLIIEAELPQNVPEKVGRLKVHWKEWDTELLNERFVNGIENIELTDEQKDDNGLLTWRTYRNDTGYSVYYGKGGGLRVEQGEPYDSYYYFSLSEGARGVMSLADYFNAENVELFTKVEAVTRAKKLLDDAGFGNNLAEPSVFALTAEKANPYLTAKYSGNLDKQGNEEIIPVWTTNDEAYVLEFTMELEGIPISAYSLPGSIMGSSVDTFPTYITMVVRNDCIPLIWCMGLIDDEYETVGETEIKISPQEALRLVVERYNGLSIPGRTTKICSCRLIYAPTEQDNENTFFLEPFWEFGIRYDDGSEFESISATYVNAQTGMAV